MPDRGRLDDLMASCSDRNARDRNVLSLEPMAWSGYVVTTVTEGTCHCQRSQELREAMSAEASEEILDGEVEMDGACFAATPMHVAFMSRGPAESRRKCLEINGSGLQQGAT